MRVGSVYRCFALCKEISKRAIFRSKVEGSIIAYNVAFYILVIHMGDCVHLRIGRVKIIYNLMIYRFDCIIVLSLVYLISTSIIITVIITIQNTILFADQIF